MVFKPKSNSDRLDYGNIILPPVGYKLNKAIGTTYSLDLETLTAVSISLGLIEDTDSELLSNPVSMLNALQKVTNKILVFCEAGQIKKPKNTNPLCLLLERMVISVALPYSNSIKRFPAFHPKTWTIEYINKDGEKLYRYLVASRNLTFDHSWDMAVTLEGVKTEKEAESTKPIIEFLNFLQKKIDINYEKGKDQRQIVKQMIKELSNVEFSTDGKIFSDFKIMPLGIGSGSYDINKDKLFRDSFHELVIMTPFLTGSIIERFEDYYKTLTNCKKTLITRKSELPKLDNNKITDFDIYVMKDTIVNGEAELSEGDEEQESKVQDIHAKFYLMRKYSDTHIYIGSMNASYAAVNCNVEMMVKLSTKNGYLNGERFLTEIMGEDRLSKNNPFEKVKLPYEVNVGESVLDDEIEQLIKQVCRLDAKGKVINRDDGKYDIHIYISELSNISESVSMRPFAFGVEQNLSEEIEFKGLNLIEVSEFFVITVKREGTTLERVIMIPIEGLPVERESEVVKSVVKDKRAFIEYVSFVLGDDYMQAFLESMQMKNSGLFDANNQMEYIPAVYEKMLKTSLKDPERLGEIQYLLKMIDDKTVIPDDFRDMYSLFYEVANEKKK